MQIRADVDEENAPLVVPGEPAVAYLKGATRDPISLRFVRIEPYVIPKKSLTGDDTERVDTPGPASDLRDGPSRHAFVCGTANVRMFFIQRSTASNRAVIPASNQSAASCVSKTRERPMKTSFTLPFGRPALWMAVVTASSLAVAAEPGPGAMSHIPLPTTLSPWSRS